MKDTENTLVAGIIQELCSELRLPGLHRSYVALCRQSRDGGWPYEELLRQALLAEHDSRHKSAIDRRIREAGFGEVKTLDEFDWAAAPGISRPKLLELASCDFIRHAQDVVIVGPIGTGKTHLATALGVEAARQGHLVRFTTAGRLVTELTEARDARELGRVVARYERIDLLVLDELAYLPLSQIDAELLFRVLGERHERRSIIVTTNLPFAEWTSIFPDPRLCRAVVDRLTHRAHIIDTGKKSIRFTETLERNNRRKEKTKDQTES